MAGPQQIEASAPVEETPPGDSDMEESGLCYCTGCRYASEYVNCCGFKPAPAEEPVELQEVRRVWSEVHERMTIAIDRNAKQLPFSVDAAFNGTIICARDQVKDWQDEDELFKKILGENTAKLSDDRQGQLRALVKKHKKLWEKPTGPIKSGTGHTIELLPGAIPPSQGYYRVGPREDDIIAGIVAEWEGDDCIERTRGSAFAAPVLLVRKEDGSYRLVVDYRRLNKVTVPNKYPAGKVEDILRRMQNSSWFSKFDLTNGFLQVMMEEKCRNMTTFVTSRGMWRFKRMPFGLINSPATFGVVMHEVLGETGLLYKEVECYVDDVLVHSPNWDSHLAALEKLFTRFEECGVALKPTKCVMGQNEVKFLGHVVSENKIAPDPRKVEAVRNWPTPTSIGDVRTFLGLTGYYRRYVRSYSIIAAPLTDLLAGSKKFDWTPECDEAFRELRDALCMSPIVCPPDWSLPFILITDAASTRGVGCVLVQRVEVPVGKDANGVDKFRTEERVIAYASRKFTPAELRWHVREQEAWAIVWGTEHFHEYLSNGHFFVETDHQSLVWLFACENGLRLMRWALRMQEYNYEIKHRPGKKNGNADALSRMHPVGEVEPVPLFVTRDDEVKVANYIEPTDDCLSCSDRKQVPANVSLVSSLSIPIDLPDRWEFIREQDNDEDLKMLRAFVREELKFSNEAKQAIWTRRAQEYEVHNEGEDGTDEVLYHPFEKDGVRKLQLVVPKSLRAPLLALHHASPLGGHLSVAKTFKRLQQRFFWEGMYRDLRKYLKSCLPCTLSRAAEKERHGLLMLRETVGYPGECVSMDLMGPLDPTPRGNRYMMTFVDKFTLHTEVEPLTDAKMETVGYATYKYICRHGCPKRFLTDQGREFINGWFSSLAKHLGVEHVPASAHHHQSNGLVERVHRVFRDAMRAYFDKPSSFVQWDVVLYGVTSALNSTEKRRLGFTPFFMKEGRNLLLPGLNALPGEGEHLGNQEDHVVELLTTLRNAFRDVRESWQEESRKMKAHYDKTHRHVEFKVGQYVVLYRLHSKKLVRQWRGVYRIIEMKSPVSAIVKHIDNGEVTHAHVQRLKHYDMGAPIVERGRHFVRVPEPPVGEAVVDAPRDDSPMLDASSQLDGKHGDVVPRVAAPDVKDLPPTYPEVDDFVIFAYEGVSEIDWFLGSVHSVDGENDQIEVQFWRSENKNSAHDKWHPVWWDPRAEKEAHSVKPRKHYEPFLTTLTLGEILIGAVVVGQRKLLDKTIDRAWALLTNYRLSKVRARVHALYL